MPVLLILLNSTKPLLEKIRFDHLIDPIVVVAYTESGVRIDDEVNVMALAAATRIGAPQDLLYVRLSLGLGMGIVSGDQMHRGTSACYDGQEEVSRLFRG